MQAERVESNLDFSRLSSAVFGFMLMPLAGVLIPGAARPYVYNDPSHLINTSAAKKDRQALAAMAESRFVPG